MKNIISGGGCFWHVEAALKSFEGIIHTEVGYTGGNDNPSYESVCNDDGNIEVVKIIYNEAKISSEQTLSLFLKIHDPISFDKQGVDIGIQYRSAIFYGNQGDKNTIEDLIKKEQVNFPSPIVIQIYKLRKYYKAEDYHQHYFIHNPNQSHCRFVIAPKLEKIRNYE